MPLVSNSITKETLEILYNSGKSMTMIAKELNCSVHKVVYWMGKHRIKRRTWSEAIYLLNNPNGDPFKIKTDLTADEMFLFGLGLGIYLGEGEKTSPNAIRVSNSDPTVLKIFIKFLLTVCQLESRKLLFGLICFNDSDPIAAKKYWANELGISEDKFGKIVQIPPQGKGTYRRKSQFGVCTLVVSSIKLKPWMMNELTKLKESFA